MFSCKIGEETRGRQTEDVSHPRWVLQPNAAYAIELHAKNSNRKSATAKTAASEIKTSSGLECYEFMSARKSKTPSGFDNYP